MPTHLRRHFCFWARLPVGAGVPANTGVAGAIYRVASFAGTPAPTCGCTAAPLESPGTNRKVLCAGITPICAFLYCPST
ncbi:hypothetical protein AL532_08805 [Pseudomonas monteilii]|nr:hypothetical protein AL532_08805 [Pseudomonas monteilii]QIG21120.1 hypothetical protein FY041_26775 [Pseudomonas monteilii]QIG26370.1 hypothetical protein FY043_26770 [Pseudomonas monteilii]